MDNEYLLVFRALSDENRIRVLELLCKGEQCACVLLSDLKISQPTLSHHMKILCRSGLVTARRNGPWIYYSIDREGCEHAGKLLDAVANHDMQRWLTLFRLLNCISRPFRRPVVIDEETPVSCCCKALPAKEHSC